MKTHDIIFSNRLFSNIANRIFYGSKDIAFAPYGEYWRQVKSISILHLFNNKRVESFRQVREDEVGQMIKKIQKSNNVVDLSELLVSLTNNVVSRVALGRTYEGMGVKNMLDQMVQLMAGFSMGNYIPSLEWMDRLSGLHRKADDLAKEIDEFCEGVVEAHLNKKDFGVEGQDLVDVLLEIQRDNSTGFHLERHMIKAIILVRHMITTIIFLT
ncbi:putative cytochrome P450 [Helianthus debilis subsp. tardiflorus]